MSREEWIELLNKKPSPTAAEFIEAYCIHRGKDPDKSKVFSTLITSIIDIDIKHFIECAYDYISNELSLIELRDKNKKLLKYY